MFYLIMAHSVMRWVVLVTALLALAGSRMAADSGSDGWGARTGLLYTVALDVQVLLGIIIWVIESGWRHNAFFAYIHPVTMILAMVVAHFGRKRQQRATPAAGFWPILVSLALVVAGIPWMN